MTCRLPRQGSASPHALALELVAHQVGAKDWNLLAAIFWT
jgi:hypothetical protein